MNCKACNKQFTGLVCYNQHMASEKHKKKMMLFQNNNTPNESFSSQSSSEPQSRNISTFPCEVCSMNFYSLSDFMQHSSSEEHAKRVLNKMSPTTVDFPSNGSGLNHPDLISQLNKDSNCSHYYSKCDLCDKTFSGPENYNQHIVSIGHRKKSASLSPNASQMENQNNVMGDILSSNACDSTFNDPLSFQQHEKVVHTKTTLAESNSEKVNDSSNSCFSLNSLICEICNLACTGPIPYNQHLQSKAHMKNLERKQLIIQLNKVEGKENKREDVIDSKPKQITPWYCEVCNKICSGPEPYREHLSSNSHKKNVAKTGAEKKQNEIQSIMSQCSGEVDIFSNQRWTTADFNMMGNDLSGVPKMSDQNVSESFQSEVSTDFHGVDLSNLNLTLFKVGEEIDFDKKEKSDINFSEMDVNDMEEDDEEEETTYDDMPSP